MDAEYQRRLYLIEILHQTTTRIASCANVPRLYLIEILHQTTTLGEGIVGIASCILLKFYIKPQPTSSFLISVTLLYLIEILHQTTTRIASCANVPRLYLIEILHQTTTEQPKKIKNRRCILLKFYIKPQHYQKRKK